MINAKQNGRISPTLSTISNFSYSSNVSGLSYSSSTETPKVPRLVPLERVFIGPNGKRHKSFKTSSESSFKPLSSADLSPTHERSKNNFPTYQKLQPTKIVKTLITIFQIIQLKKLELTNLAIL